MMLSPNAARNVQGNPVPQIAQAYKTYAELLQSCKDQGYGDTIYSIVRFYNEASLPHRTVVAYHSAIGRDQTLSEFVANLREENARSRPRKPGRRPR